ncbi:hypothetical protein E4U48_000451 [Claviceps purpurea]|nr:hypothetical protein E4U48_000451 [Claviceps purpurea]
MAGYAFLRFDRKNGTHQVVLCHVSLHAARHTCGGQILGEVLLHEMSHSWGWTHDNGYAMFAKSAKLGCVVGLCTAGIHPESGEDNNKGNGNGNGNNNGKGNGNDGDNEKGKPKSSAGRQGGSGLLVTCPTVHPKVVLLESLSEESRTATIATLKIMMVPAHIVIPLLLTPRLSPPRSDVTQAIHGHRHRHQTPDIHGYCHRNRTQVIAPDGHTESPTLTTVDIGVAESGPDALWVVISV